MNKVFLIGNLTRDPELNETTNGIKVCRFSIAVNRNFTSDDGERKTDFFNIVAWRGLGETIARFAKKGKKVAIVGSIEMRNYEDKQGNQRTSVDINATDVEFLSPRDQDDDESSYEPAPRKSAGKPTKPKIQPFDDDTDIPF